MREDSSLVIWRDSVCAGDDVDAPHETVLSMPLDAPIGQLAERLLDGKYLAFISRGRATWIFEGASPLAVFAQQWKKPRFLVSHELPLSLVMNSNARPHFNFRYWCQVDPDRVYDCLKKGEPLPDMYGR